ncbi:MAG: hypothetical protein ACI9R3_000331 [Verrucomicrobiales bacterium]|jgi:hypothetical protein
MNPFRVVLTSVLAVFLLIIGVRLFLALHKETPPNLSSVAPQTPAIPTSPMGSGESAITEPARNRVARPAMAHDAFEKLLATRPHLAAAEVASLPEATELRDQRLARLFEVWVAANPQAAADWTSALPNGVFRDEANQELGAAWGKVDTDAASLWATQSIQSGEIIPASALLSVWGRNDPTAAAEWLSSLSDAEETNIPTTLLARLSGALAYAWAGSEPEAAASWVADQQESGVRSMAVINLSAGWAEKDPDALAAWLKIHVPTDAVDAEAAYATLASHWADSQSEAAGNWATALPEGALRDTTLATFASSLAMSEPASALQWSQAISNNEARQEAALDIYDTWLDDDLNTAREALVATIPTLNDRAYQHELYNLLHEKDPVFRDELYNLILPNEDSPATPANTSNSASEAPPAAAAAPEVRRALPATEDPVDVKVMAE